MLLALLQCYHLLLLLLLLKFLPLTLLLYRQFQRRHLLQVFQVLLLVRLRALLRLPVGVRPALVRGERWHVARVQGQYGLSGL